MPHQCVRCKKFYEDGNKAILEGCECGSKLFFYVKKERLEQLKKEEEEVKLSQEDRKEIEKDVMDIADQKNMDDKPIILDFESIKILKPGQYELDLVNLFKKEPLIFKLSDGRYMIDLKKTFGDRTKK